MKKIFILSAIVILFASCNETIKERQIVSLNGTWQITETDDQENPPTDFTSKIPVPGLIDMATPKFKDVNKGSDSTRYFWYKTKFIAKQKLPDLVFLHIHKAKYSKKIYVNSKLVKEHYPSFTSLKVNIKEYITEGAENEIAIRLGTYDNFPDTMVNGHDFEKSKYYPGIYDDVELIYTDAPYIENIQTVPDLTNKKLRVVALVNSYGKKVSSDFKYTIKEKISGKVIANKSLPYTYSGATDTIDFVIDMPNCQLWSPENPFLYELTTSTNNDTEKTTFGMRTFSFDTKTNFALLNNETYFMRGTNIPLYRFFEDSERGALPWNKEWVKNLLLKFKSMNWNTVRFHVGPAPDFWYDLADSLGILVQDEYSIWYSYDYKKLRPNLKANHIAREYTDWMHERWNHPCIVIWDAQNETVCKETGEALNMVRHLDLSNRPWDNGWSRPQSDSDCIEAHPYLFYGYRFPNSPISDDGILKILLSKFHLPYNGPNTHDADGKERPYTNPVVNNEYGWFWVNRDGTPTTLSEHVFKNFYGRELTNEEHLIEYARVVSYLTEFWRTHRKCAAVMQFSALTYSRPSEPRGQTSDSFKDVEKLMFEPHFEKYIRDAFSPVGLMINSWELSYKPEQQVEIPIRVINDLPKNWKGQINIEIINENSVAYNDSLEIEVPKLEVKAETFNITMPKEKGIYQIKASLNFKGNKITSFREFEISTKLVKFKVLNMNKLEK